MNFNTEANTGRRVGATIIATEKSSLRDAYVLKNFFKALKILLTILLPMTTS